MALKKYKYTAKTSKGESKSGEVMAASISSAKMKLKKQKLKPVTVIAEKAGGKKGGKTAPAAGKKVDQDFPGFLGQFLFYDDKGAIQIKAGPDYPTTKQMAIFAKQFSIMIERSVPLVQTLGILAKQQQSRTFRKALEKIKTDVENGATLSAALEQHKKIFDVLFISLVRAGEISGKLDVILEQIVSYIERTARLKSQVKRAMIYPILIVVVSIVVVSALLMFVVPKMAEQYESSGNELPQLTQIVIDTSNAFMNHSFEIFGGLAAAIVGFIYWVKTENGRRIFDSYILTAPLIGDVMRKIAVSRFCATLSTMLLAGVSILEALTICANSSGNKKIELFVLRVREQISQGRTFSEPLMESDIFPGMVTSMVSVGEQTGNLDETLAKITEIYEEEVSNAVDAMTSMIEPIMIVLIGSIVGFIVLAMYLPIFDMASNMG